jgi:DNA-nicking Smr family endonuclease
VSKRDKPFNNPFGGLKLKVEEKSKPPKAPTRVEPKAPPEEDESALFLSSVGEVVPVKKGAPRVEPPVPESKLAHVVDPEVEALTELAELVAGNGPLDLADTDEYIEGSAPGLDPRILRRLRKGDYAVQGHLD